MIELAAGTARCTIEPPAGGRVATLSVGAVDLLVGPDPSLGELQWGSYPMVPWAGRIRRGAFTFDGVHHQLPINFETHAIHGTAFTRAWDVVDSTATSAALCCPLDWELGGSAEQTFELTPSSLTCTLTAIAGDRPMPATLGWHPWFVKPDRVDLRFARMYPRDDEWIADGRHVEPPPPPPWDDAFADPIAPPRLWIGGVEVTVDSDCTFWVVFDMPATATCVEPQSGLPDAFNLDPAVGGVVRLAPGQVLRRWMSVTWTP